MIRTTASTSRNFYPRPPRGGRRYDSATYKFRLKFLSTPSARRATAATAARQPASSDFYPRPPRGGRLQRLGQNAACNQISIHALREEGDAKPLSVHSPADDFYPRPPRGGRPRTLMKITGALLFLSTPSARRATDDPVQGHDRISISIHALREEGDSACFCSIPSFRNFYPRPPRGGRRIAVCLGNGIELISIHALREEGDLFVGLKGVVRLEFLSTPSARRATTSCRSVMSSYWNFYPRPPRGGRQQKQRQNLYFQTNYTTFCTNLEEP